MKLFQRLLVAPAALGLLAPMAVNATELNIDGVSDYAASGEQVTSITQFSDVYPTDWAYQALSNLIERYGCVAGYPNGTYRGNRAMTRFEAAALLNACLDRVTEVTDELKRLMKEFEKELAILKGRVDGLEARVGELEATQFSTTTKLKGQTTFGVGASTAGSSVSSAADAYNQSFGAATFIYDLRLALDTSFTGKDLLRTRLRSGNFGNSVFGNGLTAMEVAFEEPSGANSVGIDRVFYQFPIGSSFTATVGARVRQDDMLAVGLALIPLTPSSTSSPTPVPQVPTTSLWVQVLALAGVTTVSALVLTTSALMAKIPLRELEILSIPATIRLVVSVLIVPALTELFRLPTPLTIGVLLLRTTMLPAITVSASIPATALLPPTFFKLVVPTTQLVSVLIGLLRSPAGFPASALVGV